MSSATVRCLISADEHDRYRRMLYWQRRSMQGAVSGLVLAELDAAEAANGGPFEPIPEQGRGPGRPPQAPGQQAMTP